ncbi:putative neutral zinc metallopeptidase [anaerobic digester metagenome]
MVRWRQGPVSGNVEDRRGTRISGPVAGGAGGILVLLLMIGAVMMGVDPGQVLGAGGDLPGAAGQTSSLSAEEEQRLADFTAQVLGDTDATWTRIFAEDLGRTYTPPTLVLYSGRVESACGQASASTGPFYCPGDQKIYVDLEFFHELKTRFGAPGDFAQAYVIAHEVGHHVQTQLGTLQYVSNAQRRAPNEAEANRLSVALELQADCYAGIWANRSSAYNLVLEPGDIEEGMNAASAVGDDRLQKQSQGYVVPDSFTHGTSAQRVQSFRKGLDTGDLRAGNIPGLPTIG